jgi:hypothetical protein
VLICFIAPTIIGLIAIGNQGLVPDEDKFEMNFARSCVNDVDAHDTVIDMVSDSLGKIMEAEYKLHEDPLSHDTYWTQYVVILPKEEEPNNYIKIQYTGRHFCDAFPCFY